MSYDNSRQIEEPDDPWREGDPEEPWWDISWEDTPDVNDRLETLEYREHVVNDLLSAMSEFLSFSTCRELVKLLGNNL